MGPVSLHTANFPCIGLRAASVQWYDDPTLPGLGVKHQPQALFVFPQGSQDYSDILKTWAFVNLHCRIAHEVCEVRW